ncbi:MAG: hypothetical protein SGILL_003164 [Bacillariaceae sp.]
MVKREGGGKDRQYMLFTRASVFFGAMLMLSNYFLTKDSAASDCGAERLSADFKVARHKKVNNVVYPAGGGGVEGEGEMKLSIQSYAVSFHEKKVQDFRERNKLAGFSTVQLFPAVNGHDEKVLQEWSSITNEPYYNISDHRNPKDKTKAPFHRIGCFWSHWNLLRVAAAGWEQSELYPDALMVFEDDAICVDNTKESVLEVLRSLPDDWDILYIGGKPFQQLYGGSYQGPKTKDGYQRLQDFRPFFCNGTLGSSTSGPFAPDMSHAISPEQPYWKTNYITNTHSYIVNPKSAHKILNVIEASRSLKKNKPIDIIFAESMGRNINAYMSPMMYCKQPGSRGYAKSTKYPYQWNGYYHHKSWGVTWDIMYGPDCNRLTDKSLEGTGSARKKIESDKRFASQQVKGVFVMKVNNAEQAARTLCTLTRSLYKSDTVSYKYPIRIFADNEVTPKSMHALKAAAGGADVKVIVDTVGRARQLPSGLTREERDQVIQHCQDNWDVVDDPKCTRLNVPLRYIYMGYWRYMRMAWEESLQEFDYFVSIDADAYFTGPTQDPFTIMAKNNLTGFFNIEAYQSGSIATGIQDSVDAVFALEDRKSKFLNSPKYSFLDSEGLWRRSSKSSKHPSIWGCFYGGRLDFFRSSKYTEFARNMAPYTYTYRTDEQPIIAVAWALLAENDKVWYLPKRGIKMGVFHHGWVDDSEVVRQKDSSLGFEKHTLDTWEGFVESRGNLLNWEQYTSAIGYNGDTRLEQCLSYKSK